MPRSHLVLLGCLASSHQISQGLGTFIRNPYRRQISGSIATRQLLSIAPVRLYPTTRLDWYQRGATTSHSMPSSGSCQYTT